MNFYSFYLTKFNRLSIQIKCFRFFLVFITIYFVLISLIKSHLLLFAFLLFIAGWLTWTFVEYIVHRFWMHDPLPGKIPVVRQYHIHHHAHPTQRDITGIHRIIVLILSVGLVWVSIALSVYIMILAGFVFGFAGYMLMHWVLHQKWSVKLMPRLHRFHIYHHCKFPDSCYGVTVTWWDLVFRTVPPAKAQLSEKIISFYYGHHHTDQKRKSV